MREMIAAPVAGLDLRQHYGHHQTPAICAGGLIFCSGMVAIHPETGHHARLVGAAQADLHGLAIG